ncbi:MAG: transposase [Beijerinckiaceae bacterium]|nr:transposase [Beijerinckiaceae bacterium]
MRATRNRPVYTNEFKTEAVALARRDDRTFRELAEDLGVSVWTLRHWYKMDEMAKRKTKKADAVRPAVLAPESESLKERAARLERELAAAKRLSAAQEKKIASLETDREILKKAAAFFAKESE